MLHAPLPAEMPPPSAELAALRVLMIAHWRTLKPKQRLQFQQALNEELMQLEIEPIVLRPIEQHAAVRTARSKAVVWLGRMMTDVIRRG